VHDAVLGDRFVEVAALDDGGQEFVECSGRAPILADNTRLRSGYD
jgi:hypothetical protein